MRSARREALSKLELKVPPDVVWLAVGAVMWVASKRVPGLNVTLLARSVVGAALAALGVGLIISARVTLERAHTTWHPTEPHRTTNLAATGVFRVSRNPTYLGMQLVLIGWAVFLASPVALVISWAFALWMSRFQIRPEERALAAILGQEYRDYLRDVRRWL